MQLSLINSNGLKILIREDGCYHLSVTITVHLV